MAELALFPKDRVVGVFKGFSQGGLEFHADLLLPYRNEFQSMPMHGQFLLIQLGDENEAVLGRITALISEGGLSTSAGEDYNIRAMRDDRSIPEQLREDHLRYRVDIRVLGVLRLRNQELIFAASHRRLPHVGSRVAWPSDELLRHIVGHYGEGAELGFYALGEYIYAQGDSRIKQEPWMQIVPPLTVAKFPITSLVSRRSFIFARAGFGKSNLNKLLFSSLYSETPTIEKRGKRRPVGTIIFDPDGEYFWPDQSNQPGFCDVPDLQDRIVVFTKKEPPSGFYGSFIAGDIRLDLRQLKPGDVMAIALPADKQDQQNVRKLKGLNQSAWEELVNEIDVNKNLTDLAIVKRILRLEDTADAEATAARSNVTFVVNMLHSRSSQMLDVLFTALREGKLCIVDISQLRGRAGLIFSGIILNQIFEHNQREFTTANSDTIPTIAVLEEAQSVLGRSAETSDSPYVTWVKEGRKYDLGAVMITQQPGSISGEILSQGDNWFLFHLLSATDLQNVHKANAHFSEDLLSSLLNEPISGNGVFWSSVGGKAYPIPIRVLSFRDAHVLRDPTFTKPRISTYASELRDRFKKQLQQAAQLQPQPATPVRAHTQDQLHLVTTVEEIPVEDGTSAGEEPVDAMEAFRRQVIRAMKQDTEFLSRIRRNGMTWKGVMAAMEKHVPAGIANKNDFVYEFVRRTLIEVFGDEDVGWRTEKRMLRDGSGFTTWVIIPSQGGQ